MSGFNAEAFRKHISKYSPGPASVNLFEVVFDRAPNVLSKILTPQERYVFDNLRFRVQMADIPTRSFESQERRYTGPQRMVPFGLIYATQQIELIEDEDFTVRSIFDKWQSAVFNEKNSYTVAYYDDMVTNMTLRIFNGKGQLRKEYYFKECYPYSVQPTSLHWYNTDQHAFVPVEIAYREWTENEIT